MRMTENVSASSTQTAELCVASLITTVLLVLLSLCAPAYAADSQKVIVVRGDWGGSVRQRYDEIQRINRLGYQIEIRDGMCLSSCTMYLGADRVCVSPEAVFGFHGPYRFWSKLTQEEFNKWSQVIARHYPPVLQKWYMEKARYQVRPMLRLSGAQLIRLGVPPCDP